MPVTNGGITARQRKQVYMSSQVFTAPRDDGPSNSVYRLQRQRAMLKDLQPCLSKAYSWKPPDIELPKPMDIRCTQNAGHNAVLPSKEQEPASSPRATAGSKQRIPSPEVLVEDGVPVRVIHAGPRDVSIPREYWATSVTVPWTDLSHELHRRKEQRSASQKMPAQALKRREFSSEVMGTARMMDASTRSPQEELRAVTVDPLILDSTLDREAQRPPPRGASAYKRFANNLACSSSSSLPRAPPPDAPIEFRADENPATQTRRKAERNFSDLFGSEARRLKEYKGSRVELIETEVCNFLDTRSEISARNKERWTRQQVASSAREAKEASLEGSNIFNQRRTERSPRPAAKPRAPAAGGGGDDLAVASVDDDPGTCRTARERKLYEMCSNRVSRGLGSPVRPRPSPSPSPLRGSPSPSPLRQERAMSPKEMRIAFMQSSIFPS